MMERRFAEFREKMITATARITAEYFQLPVANAESAYRERVYCYELYHQLRSEWQQFPFSLGGEVDKGGHPHFRGGPYANSKPDLLVHHPGDMGRNLACVEVKPCTRPYAEFRDDLKKLTWFCRHAEYHGAIFLVYGAEEGETAEHDLFKAKLRRAALANDEVDLGNISILRHSAVTVRAEGVHI